jgi:hypothetical protein
MHYGDILSDVLDGIQEKLVQIFGIFSIVYSIFTLFNSIFLFIKSKLNGKNKRTTN